MDAGTRRFVRERAGERCEYCRLHHIEHIVSRQHGGSDDVENLALACHRCNLHKGRNLTGIDPLRGLVQILFHPRHDQWYEHFAFRGASLEGLTPAGRVTVAVLALNDPRRIELRQELLALGELT